MSHDTHNNGHQEKKPVAFTTPLILGAVTVFIILCFVSLGNPCHGHEGCECKENCSKECMEACEKGDHSKHPDAKSKHDDSDHSNPHGNDSKDIKVPAGANVADSLKTEESVGGESAKDAHKEEAHH
jgi:hypothetical protein